MRRNLLLIVSILTVLPFIGLTLFYSKGEPREAVVALSMINDGNWILPINNGGDIPYKPPFFHWCIALASLLQGYVSEFTARFPSALSLIATTLGTYASMLSVKILLLQWLQHYLCSQTLSVTELEWHQE